MNEHSPYSQHYSVLNKEVIESFQESLSHASNFGDMTFGAGGHSLRILEEFPEAYLYSTDQDPDALKNGELLLAPFKERSQLLAMNFESFFEYAEKNKLSPFRGIVMDLGVSSHHFDSPERGFSFRFEARLDMRMNPTTGITAEEIVNGYSADELTRILFDYGEEKQSRVIVKNILQKRSEKRIETTKELEDICFHSYPKAMRHTKISPATKTFQALRIAVNNELGVLEKTIPELAKLLDIEGVLAIITFHSLEDRIVKNVFKQLVNGEVPFENLTKKPIIPSQEEISENSRSRSAKLRVLKRISEKKSKNKYEHFSKKEK